MKMPSLSYTALTRFFSGMLRSNADREPTTFSANGQNGSPKNGSHSAARIKRDQYVDLVRYDPKTIGDELDQRIDLLDLGEVRKCRQLIEREWGAQLRRDEKTPWVNHFYFSMVSGFERLTDRDSGQAVLHKNMATTDQERRYELQTVMIIAGLHDAIEDKGLDKGGKFTQEFIREQFDNRKVDVDLIATSVDLLSRDSRNAAQRTRTEYEYEEGLFSHWCLPVVKCSEGCDNVMAYGSLNYDKHMGVYAKKNGLKVETMTEEQKNAAKWDKLTLYLDERRTIIHIANVMGSREEREGNMKVSPEEREMHLYRRDVLKRSADIFEAVCDYVVEDATNKWGGPPTRRKVVTPPNGAIMTSRNNEAAAQAMRVGHPTFN